MTEEELEIRDTYRHVSWLKASEKGISRDQWWADDWNETVMRQIGEGHPNLTLEKAISIKESVERNIKKGHKHWKNQPAYNRLVELIEAGELPPT